MTRKPGPFGSYGSRGHSVLADRRRLERENPGKLVCRRCERLVVESEISMSCGTPYCRVDCRGDSPPPIDGRVQMLMHRGLSLTEALAQVKREALRERMRRSG